MIVIVTHEAADFDAVASAVAAQLVYPEAEIALGFQVAPAVRDFLSLHRDHFSLKTWRDIDFEAVTRAVIVDVRQAGRLKAYAPLADRIAAGQVDCHIWDHHSASPDDLHGSLERIQPVGSTSTLFIEEIRRRHIGLSVVEATLLALGIYTDTGSLTYAETTARDAEALAWLLAEGASLKMVNRYLRASMSTDQRVVLSQLLGAVEVFDIGGTDVGMATVELDKNVGGLADVTTQLIGFEGHAALFVLYRFKNKIQVIARSRVAYLDAGEVMRALGGGGHHGAAAAVVKGGDPQRVRDQIVSVLNADPPRPREVRDVMTSPVDTVGPDALLSEVAERLRRGRYTGMPVVRDGKVVGIISVSDLRRAERGERTHLAVASCMAHKVVTAPPEESLESALERMVKRDVGRLPVVRNERLIGIITRSDLLRVLYKTN